MKKLLIAFFVISSLCARLEAVPPPWAHNVKKTVTKDFDFEEIVVEVDGVKAGYRYDHGKRFDLVWERDPKTLGLTKRLHAHEIIRKFPAELDPILPPGTHPISLADVPPSVVADTTPRVIDINYFYTTAAAARIGGDASMPAFAALSCELTNQSYANSGLSYITFRCLGPFKASYPDTTNLSDALNWMRGPTGSPEITAKAALTGADLSHMVIGIAGGMCGLGYLNSPDPSWGLSTSDIGCANSNLSFPHETGHNVGMNHDPANTGCTLVLKPSGLMGCNDSTYNYGHSFPIGAVKWRTFMAYPGAGGTRITIESSPNVLYQGLYPTGIVNERDNVRIAVARASVVAAFRTAVVASHRPPAQGTNFKIVP